MVRLFILIFNIIKRIYFAEGKHIKFFPSRLKGKKSIISYKEKMLSGIKLILIEIIKTRIFIFIKNLIISNTIILK